MKAFLLPPTALNAHQALGPFLDRFDATGVVLVSWYAARPHFYGQWRDATGLAFVLEWCRTVDLAGFADAWFDNAPAPAPSAAVNGGLAALDLSDLTDEAVLRQFVRRVAGPAALLVYQPEDAGQGGGYWGLWRWRNAEGRALARAAWHAPKHACPVWPEAPLGPGCLAPVSYYATVASAGAAHRRLTAARAAALAATQGWTPNFAENFVRSADALPPSRPGPPLTVARRTRTARPREGQE